jgi:hypothetical protein
MAHAASTSRPAKRLAALLACALPVVCVYAILLREMRDVPLLDDYHAVLEFVLTLRQLPTHGSRLLWVIAAQHSEYKLIFEHIIIAADWALTGRIHLEFLIVLGNLLMLGILWVLWKNYFADEPNLTRRLFLFLPICCLLFQLNYVDTLDWAMCGLVTIPVVLFSLASLHCLIRQRLGLACLFALLACFSSINAFLVAPVGLLVLLTRRHWRQVALWTASFCIAFGLYLYRYTVIHLPDHGTHVPLADKLLFWVLFLGGAAENQHRFPVKNGALVLGLLLLAIVAYAWRKGFRKTYPFAFYGTLWVLLTAAVVAEGRSGGGIATSLTGRYKIYSDLLLVFGYFALAKFVEGSSLARARQRQLYAAALACIVLFSAASDFLGYKLLLKRNMRVALGISDYVADPAHNVPMVTISGEKDVSEGPPRARVILNESLAAGIYTLPPAPKR